MKRKLTAAAATAFIVPTLMFSAYAAPAGNNTADGGLIEDIGDGAENLVDNIGDAANDVIDGVGEAVGDIAGDNETAADDNTVVNDGDTSPDSIAEMTGDDDLTDDTDDDEDERMYEAEMRSGTPNDKNPATGGLPFMTAGLVAVTAAGVAYLTKKRNIENGQYFVPSRSPHD